MTNTSASTDPSSLRIIGTWVLRILLSIAFGAAGLAKLAGASMMVAEFRKIGLGEWFRDFAGVVEIAGVAFLLWPRTTIIGAVILFGVCVGALVAQLGPLHGDVVHVLVLGAALGLIVWLARPAKATIR